MIEDYSHSSHYFLLKMWFEKRSMPYPEPHHLSVCGFVSHKTAIGFLFKTNSPMAYFDNIIVAPDASVEDRDVALLALFEALENEARSSGFKFVTVLTKSSGMVSRLKFLNFENQGSYELLFKEII